MPSGAPLVNFNEDSDNNSYSYSASGRIQPEETEKTEKTEKTESSDEYQRICSSFDAWLAAFRSTRPQRDVIWRVGNVYFADHVFPDTLRP